MKIEIQPTTHFIEDRGREFRLWIGRTDDGVEVSVLVASIGLPPGAPESTAERFERELQRLEDNPFLDAEVTAAMAEQTLPEGA